MFIFILVYKEYIYFQSILFTFPSLQVYNPPTPPPPNTKNDNNNNNIDKHTR